MFDEKNRIKKSRETVPFSPQVYQKKVSKPKLFSSSNEVRTELRIAQLILVGFLRKKVPSKAYVLSSGSL
jgi:hypothetical protein